MNASEPTDRDVSGRSLTRRRFLTGSGALVIGFSLATAFKAANGRAESATPTLAPGLPTATVTPTVQPGAVATPTNQTQQPVATRNVADDEVDSYLVVDRNGHVTIYSGKVELGTGIETALAQIVAEQLAVPFDQTSMVMGDTSQTPDQSYTAGSKSIQVAGPVLKQAAAEAKLVLLTRASARLGVPATQLQAKDGIITVMGAPAKSIRYGDLVGQPFARKVTGNAPTEPPKDFTIVGQPVPRVDIPRKITGKPIYVQDVRLEGMLHGRVVRPYLRTETGVGATVQSVDETSVRDIPGLVKVVHKNDFVGVVAEEQWQAIKAARQLKVTWKQTETLPNEADLYAQVRAIPVAQSKEAAKTGDVDAALPKAARALKATYRFPFQAHASIGPGCAVADVRPDGATIYSPTQGVYPLRDAIAELLGMDKSKVHVIYAEGAGCYGHNGADDATADAAVLSQAVGKPVRVQWMRQDAFAFEPKGPAMVVDVQAGLDGQGDVAAWDYQVWTPTHSTRPGGQKANLLAGQLIDPSAKPKNGFVGGDRNAPHSYDFPNNRVTIHWQDRTFLHQSALRSLGAMANVFANESFIDELASAAGVDAVEFRLRYLKDPRAIAVVKQAAELANWQSRSSVRATPTVASGTASGRGIAFCQYENQFTYVAVVAEVEVDRSTGQVRVTRVSVAHDCGLVINPNGLKNQIEGNVIQGTSRALKEHITFNGTQVTSLDWHSYPILTFPEVPDVQIALLDHPDQDAWGAGEPTTCPMAAAIGNAIFDATGARLRTVPFTPESVKAALGA